MAVQAKKYAKGSEKKQKKIADTKMVKKAEKKSKIAEKKPKIVEKKPK